MVGMLLGDGQSVIFDTNFNFRKDRKHMRELAEKHDTECKLIWIKTDKATSFKRATIDTHLQPTRVLGDIPKDAFDRMAKNLQPPNADESPVILDGRSITPEYVAKQLGLPKPKPSPRPAAAKAS